jgi:hypothetical protein
MGNMLWLVMGDDLMLEVVGSNFKFQFIELSSTEIKIRDSGDSNKKI